MNERIPRGKRRPKGAKEKEQEVGRDETDDDERTDGESDGGE